MCCPLLIRRWSYENTRRLILRQNRTPRTSYRPESEYEKLLQHIIRHEDDLKSTLTDQQKETFEKYKEYRADVESLTEVEAFISGFKLATRIMMEVTQSDE